MENTSVCCIADFDILLRFSQDRLFPTIEVNRSHVSRRYLDILNKEKKTESWKLYFK